MTDWSVWYGENKIDPSAAGINPIFTVSEYENDSTRTVGHKAGDTISSQRYNTITRQVSLVVAALINQFCGDNQSIDISFLSSLDDVKTALAKSIPTKASFDLLSTNVEGIDNSVDGLLDGTVQAGDSKKLNGHLGSFYLDYNNFNNTPSIPSGSNGLPSDLALTANSGSSNDFSRADHKHKAPQITGLSGVTVSTSSPTRGNNGDLWLQIL